jgi:hypothetical protein
VLVSVMLPPEVNRPTMAVQRRGLAKILVQPPKAAFDVIATEFFSSPSEASGSRQACRTDSIDFDTVERSTISNSGGA